MWVRPGEDAVIDIPYNDFPTPKAEGQGNTQNQAVRLHNQRDMHPAVPEIGRRQRGRHLNLQIFNEYGDVNVSVTIKLRGNT